MYPLVYQFLSKALAIRLFQFDMTVGLRCHDQRRVPLRYFVGIVLFFGLELNHHCWLSVTHHAIRQQLWVE